MAKGDAREFPTNPTTRAVLEIAHATASSRIATQQKKGLELAVSD